MKYRSAPLLKLLLTDRGQARGIILMAAFAGTANAALLSIVNTATSAQNKEGLLRMMVLFLIAFVLFAYCSVETFQRATMLVEKGIERVRLRITDKIARIDLHGLQKVDPAVLHGRLTQDTQVISDSGGVTAAALQSAVLITFTTIYMAFLSLPTFILGAIMIGGGLMVYVVRARTVNERIESAARREADYFDRINDLVHGFKELKLSDQRRDALAADIHATVGEVRRLKIETSDLYNRNYIFAYSLFYLLIGVVVFILPRFVQSQGKQLTELTATILFIIGPLSTVVAAIPAWSRSNLAAQRLLTLDEQLEGMYEVSPKLKSTKGRMLAPFETIELRNVVFQFSGGNGNGSSFTVGPINFTIHAGETLFIVGGNGSGKSTLLKLLTALYVPKSGQLLVDGMPVDARNRQAYRNLFSAIFSDFYLFRKMYGIDAVDAPLVADLLQMMRIENKTTFDGTGFSTLDLSTGQRKRLAMIVALIEDRPICVFDEWAADQDPEFRGYFYHSLLPSLKEKGKTVIVVSHDDRYFNVGDRVLHMEYGRVDRVLAGSEV